MSLWEAHPITEFLVCANEDGSAKANCDPSKAADWLPIEKYPAPKAGHQAALTGEATSNEPATKPATPAPPR